MASAEQLKALLRSFGNDDDQHFYAVAMQMAAHEARLGHTRLANELRQLVEKSKTLRGMPALAHGKAVPISRPRGELADLLQATYPTTRLSHMVLDEALSAQLQRIIREQRRAADILAHGLQPRRKLLLMGAPGTGKTMTGSALAGELGLPLFQVRLDGLITKFMGETAAKLRQVFEATSRTRGVYFFDEFDAIGSQRGMANDVGEIRRVLNSFLQMIEQDQSHSLIVAATNHPEILDRALFRRFDDVLHYGLPDQAHVAELLKNRLARYVHRGLSWQKLASEAEGLSYAEIVRAAEETIKHALIEGHDKVAAKDVRAALAERRHISERLGLH